MLEEGGGAEGAVDWGGGVGEGPRAVEEAAEEELFFAFCLFSCSLSDMAMAS